MNNQKKEEFYSILKINCKDKSIRQIKCLGRYDINMARKLAEDLEGQNYLHVEIVNQ